MHITRLLVALLVLLSPVLAICQTPDNQIDTIYKVEENTPGFSIAVFKANDIILEKHYGIANLDYGIPITEETLFDIGSIAKQFTAYAILLLEQRGKLSIKDPANKYIKTLPHYKKGNPTIEQLLNQTSGIKEVDGIANIADLGRNDYLSQSQMMNFILKQKTLNFTPGDYFQYTNSNYILLAQIIAIVSGKSFSDFIQDDVFLPFGMEQTIKKTSTYDVIKNRAIGYIEDDGDFYKTHLHAFIYDGDGQVLTTPRDMHKWHLGLKQIESEYPELYKKMHTRAKLNNGNVIDYGLGVEFETHNGYQGIGFDGMILGGFVSKYLYFPELDIAFFTTQNTFDADFDEQFFELVDLYIPLNNTSQKLQSNEKHNNVNLSKNDLKKYEGHYLFMGNDVEESKINSIKLKNNELVVLTTSGNEITRLKPIGNHQFLFNDKHIQFDITSDETSYTYYDSENELPWLFKNYEPYSYNLDQLKKFEGQYFNADYQISKKIEFIDNKLYVFGRNGAFKNQIEPIAKDIFDYESDPITFVRDNNHAIIGLKILDVFFKKIQ